MKVLTNLTQDTLILTDFCGMEVAAGDSFEGECFGTQTLRDSVDIQLALLQNKLNLFDGVNTLTGQQAVDSIRGYAVQTTRDGKQIVTASDRPKDFYRCYTGRSDDVVSDPKRIGEGDIIHLIASAGQSVSFDVRFVDDVYIRDGEIRYLNAGFDSHLDCEIICPAGVPFPSPAKTGTLDLVDGQFVPNANNTGAYMTAPEEVKLFRFINKMHLIGSDNVNPVGSPEPFLLYYPYFMRFTLHADPEITGVLKSAITLGLFRKKTI